MIVTENPFKKMHFFSFFPSLFFSIESCRFALCKENSKRFILIQQLLIGSSAWNGELNDKLLQGFLDSEQFIQLEDLQDDANPNFVEEVVSLFYSDSARLIQNIEQTL